MTSEPLVNTPLGKLRGTAVPGALVFKGIPYAKPPVGRLRFRPPEPAEPWDGVRAADRFGASGPQPQGVIQGVGEQDESCLFLNVWTPDLSGHRPVFVWVHGGAFSAGSTSQEEYDGAALCRRGDMVVVSLNYRLGALGFAALGQVVQGEPALTANNGLRDQVAALKWVRDQIAEFGGDPDNVTLAGESAGGMSVSCLLASPQAKGLFHRAIVQSGSAHHAIQATEGARIGAVFAEALGAGSGDIDRLRDASVEEILKAQEVCLRQTVERGPSGRTQLQANMTLVPAVDGDFLPRHPFELIESGEGSKVPLLIGTNRDEWNFFVFLTDPGKKELNEAALNKVCRRRVPAGGDRVVAAYRAAMDNGRKHAPWEVFSAVETDRSFWVPATRLADVQGRHQPVHMYRLDWNSPLFGGEFGCAHAVDLPLVFGTLDCPLGKTFVGEDPAAGVLSEAMMDAWAAFVRGTGPGHDGLPDWHPYEPQQRATMRLSTDCGLELRPNEARRAFWNDLI